MSFGIDPDLLALYDHDERFTATFPDRRREELAHLVRHVDVLGHSGSIVYSRLSAQTADAAIDEQIAFFGSIGQEFEWKAYAHDQPPDLIQRLATHGFVLDEEEAIVVLDLENAPAELLTPPLNVKRLHHLDELREVSAIRHQVRGDQIVERLAYEMQHAPDYLSVYVAYADSVPAACGWARFPEASAFASLWGGSTLPGLRNRGLYTALLAARIQEARGRGYRFVTVDAGPMSRPILEKRGFRVVTYATACTWHG